MENKQLIVYFLIAMILSAISCEKEEELAYLKGTGQVTDIDGNVYNTVIIGHPWLDMGEQEWMAENLRVTHYNDGSPIEFESNSNDWHHTSAGQGLYTWYEFSYNNYGVHYGALYNGYVIDNSRGLCPAGWRVPTKEEWEILTVYLGTRTNAGGKMKSTRTAAHDSHPRWDSPNTEATNASGFSALPAGRIDPHGNSDNLGTHAFWWTSSIDDATHYYGFGAHHDQAHAGYSRFHPLSGFSVRCIKD